MVDRPVLTTPGAVDEFLRNRPKTPVPDGVPFEDLSLSEQHAALRSAFDGWATGAQVGACMIGDVVKINQLPTQKGSQ